MSDKKKLIDAWQNFSRGEEAIIACVVKTRGSAYRRPGARMLIRKDGSRIGSVSGGCLELDLLSRAQALFEAQENCSTIWYDTSRDDDVLFGSGLGCDGETVILLKKLVKESQDPDLIKMLKVSMKGNDSTVIATVFASSDQSLLQTGATVNADRIRVADSANTSVPSSFQNEFQKATQRVSSKRRSEILSISTESNAFEIFFEYLPAPIHLTIFGAGEDAIPLADLAKTLHWNLSIVDWRTAMASPSRFPEGTKIFCTPFESLSKELPIGNAVVIMSHSLSNDLSALRFVLSRLTHMDSSDAQQSLDIKDSKVAQVHLNTTDLLEERSVANKIHGQRLFYVGMLGPKRRAERLFRELESEGLHLSNKQMERFRFPAGLDIGAEGPEEIAISIVSEIKAVFENREGGFLKDRRDSIYDPIPHSKESLETSTDLQKRIDLEQGTLPEQGTKTDNKPGTEFQRNPDPSDIQQVEVTKCLLSEP